jgi:serralysin
MSARSRSTIAANSAAILKNDDFWICSSAEGAFKAMHGAVSSESMALAAMTGVPAVTIGVPSTILLNDTISPPGDTDVFAFGVVSGRTYMISMYGSGANPLVDSLVALFNAGGSFVNLDDDGGSGTNALLTFTATSTGTWFIQTQAYPGSGLTGQYTLDVLLQPLGDVVGDTFGAAPLIGLGVSYGFIDAGVPPIYGGGASETDTFKINMTAGKYYTIEVAGGADYDSDWFALPAGELDPIIFLYDSDGNEVAFDDDIAFPSDISAQIGFFAQESGSYYLDVQSYAPWTGGYSITLNEYDPADFNPLDAINWFSADNIDIGPGNTVKVYFAAAGESFGELADNGTDPLPSFGWNAFEKQQVFDALQEYTKILGITYVETNVVADAEFRLITTTSEDYGAYFYPQDPAYGSQQGIGAFNVDSGGWNFDQQQALVQGGYAFAVLLHELGHAHGLAHPHDNGGGSDIMLGVTGPFDSYGIYDLNQGVYTVMSYNDAWPLHPDGPSPFTVGGIDNGWSGTLSAFDIALLQQRYGVASPYAAGNSVYTLKDVAAQGTYYETIWDTGGTDEIRYNGNRDATIDLTAATLDYSATGGGVMSFVREIKAGFTIAAGVLIEKGTGGNGDDVIIGNGAANTLAGNGGDDFLMGRTGADALSGGSGFDTASYALAAAGVIATLNNGGTGSGSGGEAAGDTYTGIEKLEGSKFNDTLTSNNGADTLSGLGGNDLLTGNNGEDVLEGGDGDDSLSGGNAADDLDGGAGADSLAGGSGDDHLNGGAGDDVLSGGNGNDVFSFSEIGGSDRITDMTHSDRIDLTLIDAVAGGADNAFTFIGASAFGGVAGQLRSYSSLGNFFVEGDVDGDGLGDFIIQTNILAINNDLIL